MKVVIETTRLYLRELTPQDAKAFFDLNSDPEIMKYTGEDSFDTIDDARLFLENYDHYKKYGHGRWAVILKSNNEFLGWAGIKFTPANSEYDIGFRFFKKYWGQGLATEASMACLEYGREDLKIVTIVGRAMKDNLASIKILKKIGFKFEREFDFEGSPGVIYKS